MNTTGKTRKPVLLSSGSIYLPDIVQCPTDKNHHPGAAWSVLSHQGAGDTLHYTVPPLLLMSMRNH